MREYLIHLRMKQNESQQSVADSLGISRQYYSLIESGERQKNMDITLLSKLSDVFHIPLAEMVELERNNLQTD